MHKTKILSCGKYLPEKILTNDELSQNLDTSHQWIVERTGITRRHIAAKGEYSSDLGYKAALDALQKANMAASEIDLIIVATTTPDNIFPSTATKIQHKLNIKTGFAFDIQAVCSGFVYALSVADKYIKTGTVKNILVIGAETLSRILDWQDRNSCVLFGDGAGAVILTRNDDEADMSDIIDSELKSDGSLYDILKTSGGPSLTGGEGVITMQGKEVFKHAVTKMSDVVQQIVTRNNLTIADIDLVIPHQANKRILSSVAQKLGLQEKQLISTVELHANTSSASIPLALYEALVHNRVNRGDYVVFEALGAGLTWGSILVKW